MQDAAFYQQEYKNLQQLRTSLQQYKTLYFYGAGLRGEEMLERQKEGIPFWRRPKAFLVTDKKDAATVDPGRLDGIPILGIDEIEEFPEDSAVLVVAMSFYHKEIKDRLARMSCSHVYYLTDAMEQLLTREFLSAYLSRYQLPFGFLPFGEKESVDPRLYANRLHTYSVMCERDAKTAAHFSAVPWISDLQGGASKANKRIAAMGDDTGENISDQNAYYNELTGLYWVWKNTNHEFSGICHYRRRFESEAAMLPLLRGEADVILPLPFVVGQNLRNYYQHWGEAAYYETMLRMIEEKYPAYYNTACWCAAHPVFLPNNICIARREILEEYCSFLFDIVFSVEKEMAACPGKKQSRCWLSEHVSTIYFLQHCRDYRMFFSKIERCW